MLNKKQLESYKFIIDLFCLSVLGALLIILILILLLKF
jgi:hypothetical protein